MRRDDLGSRADDGATVGGIARVQRDQPGVVDPAVGIFERL
jgi:hypothetical protein